MKQSLGDSRKNNRSSFYQQFRLNKKSQLDCSDLLSNINQLDTQMSKYDQLRKRKMSQSQLTQISQQHQSLRSSFVIQRTNSQIEQQPLFYKPLTPIIEYQKSKPIGKLQEQSFGSKGLNKTVGNPKQGDMRRQQRKQKVGQLRLKTKQLQQQILQLYSSDILKKSSLNKQFNLILKMLQ